MNKSPESKQPNTSKYSARGSRIKTGKAAILVAFQKLDTFLTDGFSGGKDRIEGLPISESNHPVLDKLAAVGDIALDAFDGTIIAEQHRAAIERRGIQARTIKLMNGGDEDKESGQL